MVRSIINLLKRSAALLRTAAEVSSPPIENVPAVRPLCAFLIALVALAAGSARAAEPYDVYAILPLTGPNAFAGNEEREALTVLQSAVNRGGGIHGRSLHFAILDSQSVPQTAVQLTTGVIAKHVAVLIGDSANATCTAMAPLVANDGPLQFCLSPGFKPVRDGYSYIIGQSPTMTADAILRYLRGRGWRRIALLNGNDATGTSMQSEMTAGAAKPENAELKIVADERFDVSGISIAAQLAKIRAADPQVLVAYNSGSPFGVVVRGLRDAALDVPLMTSQGNLSYTELKTFGDSLPRRLFFESGPLPAAGRPVDNGPLEATDLAYLDAFRRQGIKPDWGHATAWDTGVVIVAALRARGLDAGPAEIRAYVNGLHGFPGIQGMLDFRSGDMRGLSDERILSWDKERSTWTIVSAPGGAPKP
jgi:branched-chain amino acid transport system substrate-binding protein